MLTDDAYAHGYAGCEPFGPNEDYDPMYEDPGDGTYRCGRGEFRDIPCCLDYDGKFVGPGCRHCNPVDPECKPYGFGIERFEQTEALRIVRELKCHAATGLIYLTGNPADWLRRALTWVGFSFRRERHSDRVWERLCDECETHTEAVEKYTAWAKRAVTVKYRDEK